MGTATFLAWRFLREGRMQTLLVVLGATVGITVVFFLTALITAVERTMISQTLDVLPHVVVRRPDEAARSSPVAPAAQVVFEHTYKPAQRLRAISDWQSVLGELDKAAGVIGASPTATGPALASRGLAMRAVSLMGVDRARFASVIAIEPRIRKGTFRLGANEAVIGTELANDLGVEVGDRIQVSTSDTHRESFTVSGIFDLGNRDVNRRWVLVSLRHGQTLLDLVGGVSSIDLRIADIWQADAVAGFVHAHTGLTAESWTATNAQLTAAIQSQRGATVMIRVFVSLAVAIGIASVLVVSVVQKGRQIGILRAMGVSRGTILRTFLWQGGAIGLAGAILGSGLGSMLAIMSERGSRNPDGSAMYPIQLTPTLYASALIIAFISGVVASVMPARRAARLDPAVAIRNE